MYHSPVTWGSNLLLNMLICLQELVKLTINVMKSLILPGILMDTVAR